MLPTAWQAVTYAECPAEGSLLVLGLGPIGDMACRIALHNNPGRTVIGVDLVPERLERARARGVITIDLNEAGDNLLEAVQSLTDAAALTR